MLNTSDEAIDRLIELAGMTGRVIVYVGLICACYLVWKLVYFHLASNRTYTAGAVLPYGSVPAQLNNKGE